MGAIRYNANRSYIFIDDITECRNVIKGDSVKRWFYLKDNIDSFLHLVKGQLTNRIEFKIFYFIFDIKIILKHAPL